MILIQIFSFFSFSDFISYDMLQKSAKKKDKKNDILSFRGFYLILLVFLFFPISSGFFII